MRFRESNEVVGRITTPAEGYKALAASVIALACDDYMSADLVNDTLRMQSIERFLLSEYFTIFSDGVDGSYILRRLKENIAARDAKGKGKAVCSYDVHGEIQNTYASASEAAEDFGGDRRSITRACNNGRLCYGFYWKYATESNNT